MSLAKITEITAESDTGFEHAIESVGENASDAASVEV